MRLTPAQIAVRLICGEQLQRFAREELSLSARIQSGRLMLRQMTGEDFGYDLVAWHNHLKESRNGGYTYGRNIVLPKIMQEAVADPEWRVAVEILKKREERRKTKAGKR